MTQAAPFEIQVHLVRQETIAACSEAEESLDHEPNVGQACLRFNAAITQHSKRQLKNILVRAGE